MTASRSKVQQFLLQCAIPIFCSVVIGSVFHGLDVFDRYRGAFQFVWTAVVASVFYNLLIRVRTRDALLGFFLLLLLTVLTTHSRTAAFILRDIFYGLGIGASVFVYHRYFRQIPRSARAYPALMLGGIYAIVNIIVLEVNLWIIRNVVVEHAAGDPVTLASTAAYFGVLIGCGVGAGIAINESVWGAEDTGHDVPVDGNAA